MPTITASPDDVALAPFSRNKGRKGLFGGTVRSDEAETTWTRCRRLGGAFRIIDGRTLYAFYGPPLVPTSPGANHGTFGSGFDLRVTDVTNGFDGAHTERQHFEGAHAANLFEAQCRIEYRAGRRLYPHS